MGRITELLDTAHSRSRAHSWSFAGAMLPHEAHELRQLAPGTRLIDVRSRAELELSGVIPDALHVEWQSWPGWVLNPHFMAQLTQATDPESLLIFICRNGVRSHGAAAA
ncbi:MAG: rhodanese-like domain-containing protein, partial [Thiobacillus sp.]